jgi:hypothetical protein
MGKLLGPSTAIVPCENYKDKQTPRADFWLRLTARTREKTPNFPINEYWRNASRLPSGTPSPAADSPPSCSKLRSDRIAWGRIAQRQPFDSMLLHDERQHLYIPNPTNSVRICRDSFVGSIKHRDGELALYRWKLMQKFTKALATFQVIEKGTDWNTDTDKYQAAAEDIGVSVRKIGKCGHGICPYSAVSISLACSGT